MIGLHYQFGLWRINTSLIEKSEDCTKKKSFQRLCGEGAVKLAEVGNFTSQQRTNMVACRTLVPS